MSDQPISPSRVWFLTGASSGLGRALAQAVLAAGDRLVATARRTGSLDDLAAAHPDTCRVLPLDVTDPDAVRDTVASAAAAWGRLDVVVNNAGYGLVGALEEVSEEQIRRNLETNLLGPIRVMRAALPVLRAQRAGHLLNVSAAAAVSNYAGFSVYGGAKWGLEGVTEAVRAEVAPLGIRVTLIVPGPFRTGFIARSLDRAATALPDYAATSGKFAQYLDRMDGRQPGDPARAAAAIVQLVHADQAPLRFYLGKYVLDKVRKRNLVAERETAECAAAASACDAPA